MPECISLILFLLNLILIKESHRYYSDYISLKNGGTLHK